MAIIGYVFANFSLSLSIYSTSICAVHRLEFSDWCCLFIKFCLVLLLCLVEMDSFIWNMLSSSMWLVVF